MVPALPRSFAIVILVALSACDTPTDTAASEAPDASGGVAPDTSVSSGPIADRGDDAAPQPSPSGDDQCNAAKATEFVGRNGDDATRAQLEATVAPVTTIRWVGPGTATTEDFSLSRLNVMLDLRGTITSAHCG